MLGSPLLRNCALTSGGFEDHEGVIVAERQWPGSPLRNPEPKPTSKPTAAEPSNPRYSTFLIPSKLTYPSHPETHKDSGLLMESAVLTLPKPEGPTTIYITGYTDILMMAGSGL